MSKPKKAYLVYINKSIRTLGVLGEDFDTFYKKTSKEVADYIYRLFIL
jgi:hypothetical protein